VFASKVKPRIIDLLLFAVVVVVLSAAVVVVAVVPVALSLLLRLPPSGDNFINMLTCIFYSCNLT